MEFLDKFIGGYDKIGRSRPPAIDIYMGGQKYSRSIGNECEFQLRDILISLKYADLEYGERNTIFEKISEILRLESIEESNVIEELHYLLSLSDEHLSYIYVNKFRLYLVFSDSARSLFMNIKDYFQKQIEVLVRELNINLDSYINKWRNMDKKEGINSSSIMLYNINKDKEFLKEIKAKELNENISAFNAFITSIDNWSYPGFCPYDPSDRTRQLINFPLNAIFSMLSNHEYIEKQKNKLDELNISDIIVPSPPYNITSLPHKEIYKNKIQIPIDDLRQLIGKLICRLENIKPILQNWEKYYIEYAKIYAKISKKIYDVLLDQ